MHVGIHYAWKLTWDVRGTDDGFFPPISSHLMASKMTQIGDCVLHLSPESSSQGWGLWGRSVLCCTHPAQQPAGTHSRSMSGCDVQVEDKAGRQSGSELVEIVEKPSLHHDRLFLKA